jgi:hypothetical protein
MMITSYGNDKEAAVHRAAEQARIAALTPEQRAAEAKQQVEANESTAKSAAAAQAQKDTQERDFNRAKIAAFLLKKTMRDPESFTLESILVMHSGSVCIDYRARNGFNGMNKESAVFLAKGGLKVPSSDGFASAWNRSCAGGNLGTDYTKEVQYVLDANR